MGLFHHDHHHHPVKKSAVPAELERRSNPMRNIGIALALNISFAFIELIGGLWTNSVAVQADAIHDFGDSTALFAAVALQFVSGLGARGNFSYGFKRFSLLSSLLTSIILLAGACFVIYRAVPRLWMPQTPHLQGMLGLAILGVVINGFAAVKMYRGHTLNERALAWHMIEDLLGWVAVLISSVVMMRWEAPWLDPTLSLLVTGVVIAGAGRNLVEAALLFMQALPRGMDQHKIEAKVRAIPGVNTIEDFRLWSLDGEHHVCSMRVVIDSTLSFVQAQQVVGTIKRSLLEFGSLESTVEIKSDGGNHRTT